MENAQTSQRIEKIKNLRATIANNALEKEKMEWQALDNAMTAVRNLAPRINELLKVKNSLIDNGIKYHNKPLESGNDDAFTRYFKEHKGFESERIHHELGFYDGWEDNIPFKDVIGFCGGGVCGSSFFVDVNGTIVCGLDKKTNDVIKHCKSFIACFDEFEKRFYDFIDKIEEIYSQK